MNEIAVKSTPDLLGDLLAIDDAYKTDTRLYIEFIKENGYDLMSGFLPYAAELEKGFTDRTGRKKTYSARTVNTKLSAAKHRIRYALKRSEQWNDPQLRMVVEDTLDSVKSRKVASTSVDPDAIPSEDEIQRLVADERVNYRTRLFIKLLAQTGMRVSEALNIRQSDIKQNGVCWVVDIVGKGKKSRPVKVSFGVMADIQKEFAGREFLLEHGGKQYSRVSVTGRIKAAAALVLERNMSAHVLRHTWATTQLDRGEPIDDVSKYLGHASVQTTLDTYTHRKMSASSAMLFFD